jgi:channel protein (hemolysin III family)
LYGVSTLYNALPSGPGKTWLNRLDHAAIYLFIAGNYMGIWCELRRHRISRNSVSLTPSV